VGGQIPNVYVFKVPRLLKKDAKRLKRLGLKGPPAKGVSPGAKDFSPKTVIVNGLYDWVR